MKLNRTGKMMKFHEVAIGQPFYVKGRDQIFIRNDTEAGVELKGSTLIGAMCLYFDKD